jgi:hypothetical protein
MVIKANSAYQYAPAGIPLGGILGLSVYYTRKARQLAEEGG